MGTVTGVDVPDEPLGVRVELDEPVDGARIHYAEALRQLVDPRAITRSLSDAESRLGR